MVIGKKGQMILYINFIVTAIVIILIAAVLIPVGIQFNTAAYAAGESMILKANSSIGAIQNESARSRIQSTLQSGLSHVEENISMNIDLFKYSWIGVLAISALVLFMYGRRLVETGYGGFV